VASLLNNKADDQDVVARDPTISYNTVASIWIYDEIAASRILIPTGFDWASFGGLPVAGEGQIFPQAMYGVNSDMKQKIVEVDFGGTPTYTGVFDIIDAEVVAGVSIVAVQVGVAPTGRPLDENEMDMFNIVGAPAIPATGKLRLYISSRMGPVTGKYKFGYTIGTL